jgi:hypothetical protein
VGWWYHHPYTKLPAGDARGTPIFIIFFSILSFFFRSVLLFYSFHSSLLSIQYFASPPVLVEFPIFALCVQASNVSNSNHRNKKRGKKTSKRNMKENRKIKGEKKKKKKVEFFGQFVISPPNARTVESIIFPL